MQENNNNNANVPIEVRESYQPDVNKTYSPTVRNINGNYQPVIPAAVGSQRNTPPTGGSGVPPARNGSSGTATPVAKK
jgi:hypothetical protein